jgi:hypothetical protein
LDELLRVARDKNARLGITGMLLYKDGAFIQALEGDEPVVQSLYDEIRHDQRHGHITILSEMEIAARQFPNWSMEYKDLGETKTDAAVGPDLSAVGDEPSWKASIALGLLAAFAPESVPLRVH